MKTYTKEEARSYYDEVFKRSDIIDKEDNKMTFKFKDLQFKDVDEVWRDWDGLSHDLKFRFKPDYSKEIEALEKKAAKYGEKVIINFKVLSNDSNIDNIKPDPSERPITTTIMRNGKFETINEDSNIDVKKPDPSKRLITPTPIRYDKF
jgi:hypothetical protein